MSDGQPASESRKTLYTAIAVTVLLAISVAVAAARPDSAHVKPQAKPVTKPAIPKPSAPATRSADATGAPNANQSAPGSKPSRAPAPNTSQGAPAKPAAPVDKGQKLADLKAPPERTIGMIVVPKDFKSARYSVTFSPYGWGPTGDDGGRLVVKITKSTPLDEAAKALDRDFTNRNATLWCSKSLTEQITAGGTYEGTIEIRREGETGILVLTELKTQ